MYFIIRRRQVIDLEHDSVRVLGLINLLQGGKDGERVRERGDHKIISVKIQTVSRSLAKLACA